VESVVPPVVVVPVKVLGWLLDQPLVVTVSLPEPDTVCWVWVSRLPMSS
jgi:hypothetical protein